MVRSRPFLQQFIPLLCLALAQCTAESRDFSQAIDGEDGGDLGQGSTELGDDAGPTANGPDAAPEAEDSDASEDDDALDDDHTDDALDDDAADDDAADDDALDDAADDELSNDDDAGTSDDTDAPLDDDDSDDDGALPDDDSEVLEMSCATGEHFCPDRGCVSDDSTETCGGACEPCVAPAGGVVACDGIACLGLCLGGEQLCGDTCIDAAATCDPSSMPCLEGEDCTEACPASHQDCGGTCTPIDDPAACGESCEVCPIPANGNALCALGGCSIQCDADYHACGDECFADADETHCGVECVSCEPPVGGSAECVDDQCSGTCPMGQLLCAGTCIAEADPCDAECPMGTHDCSGSCLSETSIASCGELCTPCPAPISGGTATCTAGECGIQCNSGYHACGDECAADSDATACGSACTSCPVPAQGLAVCLNGTCGIACSSGYHACGSSCVDNDEVATCGQSCTPCVAPTGGTVSCNGTSCQPACPSAQQICNGSCIANTAPCAGACSAGFHACSGVCFSDALSSGCEGLSWNATEGEFGPTNHLESKSFTLRNNSPAPVTDLDTQISLLIAPGCESSPNDMWHIASNTCAGTLNSGQSCTVVVDFDGDAVDVGGCFNAELAAEGDQYTARLPLSGSIIGYTWQIAPNDRTFTYDSNAPVVGESCVGANVVRDARPTEIASADNYELVFTTTPPSQGTCAAGNYAVAQSTCYTGPNCSGPWQPSACSLTCIGTQFATNTCRLVYYRLRCMR